MPVERGRILSGSVRARAWWEPRASPAREPGRGPGARCERVSPHAGSQGDPEARILKISNCKVDPDWAEYLNRVTQSARDSGKGRSMRC